VLGIIAPLTTPLVDILDYLPDSLEVVTGPLILGLCVILSGLAIGYLKHEISEFFQNLWKDLLNFALGLHIRPREKKG